MALAVTLLDQHREAAITQEAGDRQHRFSDVGALVFADEGNRSEFRAHERRLNHNRPTPCRAARGLRRGGQRGPRFLTIRAIFPACHEFARRPLPDPAQDPDRTLHRGRPAGRLARTVALLRPGAVTGHRAQRDERSRGDGIHGQPAHLGRPHSNRAAAIASSSIPCSPCSRWRAPGCAPCRASSCPTSRSASSTRPPTCCPSSPSSPAWSSPRARMRCASASSSSSAWPRTASC